MKILNGETIATGVAFCFLWAYRKGCAAFVEYQRFIRKCIEKEIETGV